MTQLKAVGGELRATVHVKRAVTGLVETFELVGHENPDKLAEILENRRREAAGEYLDPDLLIENPEGEPQ